MEAATAAYSDELVSDTLFSKRAADALKALAHPIRFRIIVLLCGGGAIVGQMADRLGVPQSTLSQQLRVLRMQGLVSAERANGFARYELAEPKLRELVYCMDRVLRRSHRSE